MDLVNQLLRGEVRFSAMPLTILTESLFYSPALCCSFFVIFH